MKLLISLSQNISLTLIIQIFVMFIDITYYILIYKTNINLLAIISCFVMSNQPQYPYYNVKNKGGMFSPILAFVRGCNTAGPYPYLLPNPSGHPARALTLQGPMLTPFFNPMGPCTLPFLNPKGKTNLNLNINQTI